ncbi:mechanosensitive ion channel family protein [Halorussus halophilus]|uniref:mechanosensitive ion channel family protein n=1 Tax=Halorussus halophilus TaxID=2650975 RepID=UPI00130113CB|nr:mechanosensitive ion channel family protein [Halorussus halophilus]
MISLAIWAELTNLLDRLPQWQAVLLIAVASFSAAGAIQLLGDPLLRRVTTRIDGEIDDVVLRTLHPALYVSALLVGFYLVRQPLNLAAPLDTQVRGAVLSLLVVVWGVTFIRIGRKVSNELTGSDRVEQSVVPIFQNVWTVGVLGASSLALLRIWNYDVTPLLASAGILGIVLGFAAKDTVANLFGSLALYFDGTYRVGDYIVTEGGDRGRVEDISIRSTVVRTRDDVLVTIPNAVLNSSRIINESEPGRKRRIRLPISVAYESDLDYVEDVLLEAVEDMALVRERPSPRVRYRAFGDSGVELELLCWIETPVLRGRGTHEVLKATYAALNRANVEVPFPQRDLRLRTTDSPATTGMATDFTDETDPAAN